MLVENRVAGCVSFRSTMSACKRSLAETSDRYNSLHGPRPPLGGRFSALVVATGALRDEEQCGGDEKAGYSKAMSQENVQRTYQAIEAFNRRDLQGHLELMDPELEFMPYEVYLEGGDAFRGHAGVRQWWEDLFAVLPDVRAEIFEIRDFGSRTVVHGRLYGRGAGSGAPIERTMWLVNEWRGDKEVWWGAFGSEEEALEAVRRSELRRATLRDASDV